MIQRIHQNSDFLAFHIPSQEVLDKLGRENPIHIDPSPNVYMPIWKSLNIEFLAIIDSKASTIPDISESSGRLFLNIRAYAALKYLLSEYGEFLPISYSEGSGYIFNPLKIAEEMQALNESLTVYDENENLEAFSFHEEKINKILIFKAKIDNYSGVFCTDSLKDAIEKENLTGVFFQPDLANYTGDPYPVNH